MELSGLISALVQYKADNMAADKAAVELRIQEFGTFRKGRSVYSGNGFGLRVSEANTKSFQNVVLSLSALMPYDKEPMVICVVRPDRIDFRLANSTFLKKVSHSSQNLAIDNVRGSFLGNDIMDNYEGILNRPENFDQLWAIHVEFDWAENLERLVGTTNLIAAKLTRFEPSENDIETILAAPERAVAAIKSDAFRAVEYQLVETVERNRRQLLDAASLDNVNLRGNRIEAIMTGEANAHRLDDAVYPLPDGGRLVVDIKTKLLDRASAPKAYNVDKMLKLLAEPGATFAFFFIGLSVAEQVATGRLVSMFDPTIIKAIRVQHHWAGRASRGVTQLTGDTTRVLDSRYCPTVNVPEGKTLLRILLEK